MHRKLKHHRFVFDTSSNGLFLTKNQQNKVVLYTNPAHFEENGQLNNYISRNVIVSLVWKLSCSPSAGQDLALIKLFFAPVDRVPWLRILVSRSLPAVGCEVLCAGGGYCWTPSSCGHRRVPVIQRPTRADIWQRSESTTAANLILATLIFGPMPTTQHWTSRAWASQRTMASLRLQK